MEAFTKEGRVCQAGLLKDCRLCPRVRGPAEGKRFADQHQAGAFHPTVKNAIGGTADSGTIFFSSATFCVHARTMKLEPLSSIRRLG